MLGDILKKIQLDIHPQKFGNLTLFEIKPQDLKMVLRVFSHEMHLPLKTVCAKNMKTSVGEYGIFYIFGSPKENYFFAPYILVGYDLAFPSGVDIMHELSLYEREIHTFFGLKPVGHPDLRPLHLHENWPENVHPLRKEYSWNMRPPKAQGSYEFHKISGDGIYEIPVGPVHAGIIEPGHFRFSVVGEEIVMLEPRLGYAHKGSEKLFEIKTTSEAIKLSERISGDNSYNHSLAFCQALEAISKTQVSSRARYLRVFFAELERIANHLNDIGFIMLDTGFTFGGSQCARLREKILQINERIGGNRFLRGINVLGGVTKDIIEEDKQKIAAELKFFKDDFREIMEIASQSAILLNRLKETGVLENLVAQDHGVVGVAARASGIECDSRIDFSYAAYSELECIKAIEKDGDVYARFMVREKEIKNSIHLIEQVLLKIPFGALMLEAKPMPKSSYAIGIAEGWRGDIVYFIATDEIGNLSRVKVRDPSFLNWPAVPYAVKGNVVPDFPLINKSFNLSYSGNDL